MKNLKKISLSLLVFAFLPFILVGCDSEMEINSYRIDACFNEETKSLSCVQETIYVNNSENSMSEICFYLYANAFSEGQKTVPTSYTVKAYPNGESFGNIEFETIKIGDSDAVFEFNEEKSILSVNLEQELFPSERVCIEMNYTINLANINHRLGYGDDAINFGNFFPIVCVYEDGKGFVKNSFASNGDPFYSDVSNFDVTIDFDDKFKIASTGNKIEEVNGKTKSTRIIAKKVRDFCFVLSENFEVMSEKVGDITVNYFYYDDELAKSHLKTSVDAVETYQNLFGRYPYEQLSVVQTNFCFGGMEYPNLVMISDALNDDETFNYVIAHEIAHQWWYGVVGNNEFEEAWIDEGLTEFSTLLFFENNAEYGVDYEICMQNAKESYKNFVSIYSKIHGDVDESMDRNLNEYDTEPEYVNCIYTKGMLLFESLRETMNERKFFKCLKTYYQEMSFKNAGTQDVVTIFSKTSKINLQSFFDAWLNGNVVIN